MRYRINDIIDKYKLIKIIGKGSFGTVFEAVRTEGRYEYRAAIKIIELSKNDDVDNDILFDTMSDDSVSDYYESMVEELVAECALMESMKGDSHIVSYEDHQVIVSDSEDEWTIIIRMELLAPFSLGLKKLTKLDHYMTEKDVIKLGIDICRALETCEKKNNVIHRDIKPENIFVTNTGNYKLGDFGIAKVLGVKELASSRKGTESYMAPEVYIGSKYDNTADIFSLGMVMYRLLNKSRPPFYPPAPLSFTHEDRIKAFESRMKREKTWNKPIDASEGLSNIILKACSYDPNDRFHNPRDMRIELENLIGRDLDSNYTDLLWKAFFDDDILDESVEEKTVSAKELAEKSIDKVDTETDRAVDLYEEEYGTVGFEQLSGGFISLSEAEERQREIEREKRLKEQQKRIEEEKRRIEEENRKKVEEENRRRIEEEKRRIEEENRRKLEEENRRRIEEENKRIEEENRRKLEEENRKRIEEEKKRKLEEEQKSREINTINDLAIGLNSDISEPYESNLSQKNKKKKPGYLYCLFFVIVVGTVVVALLNNKTIDSVENSSETATEITIDNLTSAEENAFNEGFEPEISKIIVPNLVGEKIENAEMILEHCELNIIKNTAGQIPEDKIGEYNHGDVISQDIEPDSEVDRNTTITVIYIDGYVVPKLEGMSLDNAKQAIEKAGLSEEVLSISEADYKDYQISDHTPKVNEVIKQEIKEGNVITQNEKIKIVVQKEEQTTASSNSNKNNNKNTTSSKKNSSSTKKSNKKTTKKKSNKDSGFQWEIGD
ncbi:MAG: protein kinase [Lachnospiraceae bacterium]|nr:protein kinase [Lachnospiraceae bacterium]